MTNEEFAGVRTSTELGDWIHTHVPGMIRYPAVIEASINYVCLEKAGLMKDLSEPEIAKQMREGIPPIETAHDITKYFADYWSSVPVEIHPEFILAQHKRLLLFFFGEQRLEKRIDVDQIE